LLSCLLLSILSLVAADQLLSDNEEANLFVAVRQRLFDYATSEGITLLPAVVATVAIPPYDWDLDVALIGRVHVGVTDLVVQQLDLPPESAETLIEGGTFHITARRAGARLGFNFQWSAGSIVGDSGQGELILADGVVDLKFRVASDPTVGGPPAMTVDEAAVHFETVDVRLKNSSADWLYGVSGGDCTQSYVPLPAHELSGNSVLPAPVRAWVRCCCRPATACCAHQVLLLVAPCCKLI
jgi:hypothetical protein